MPLMKPSYFFALLLFITSTYSFASGLKGTIKGDDGAALAFASVYVKQNSAGAATDMDGRFEMTLAPGEYDILFQYLGYETAHQKIVIGNDFVELNIVLKTQVIVLQNVVIKAGKEDPAYTIMRKAIAKAKFHTQQIDTYSAKVYIKGKGQLKDYPWFAKKAVEKEGITKDRVFISESVSEIKYTRPKKFEEKVIAVYTKGKERNTSPNQYVFGSFYEAEIAEIVSPLSPKAFSYYKFEYLGSFKDNFYEVSKIKVTPRSRGDNVFDGIIFIVEDWWSIHSLDLRTTKLGIHFKVKQIYNPIEDKAWLPISQHFFVDGKVFGFDFTAEYLATLKDYKIKLNPELAVPEMTMVDEKIDKQHAKEVEKKFSKKDQQIQERLAAGKEVTNKELRQMIREYEKEEQKETKEPEVISETYFKVDSSAYKKDSSFWAETRPVALSKQEERGYVINDSMSVVERKREEGDTLKSRKGKKGFRPTDLLVGNSYKLTKTANFQIHFPYGGFNTVEGFNLIYRTSLYKRWSWKDTADTTKRKNSRLEISPILRYSFAREKLTGKLRIEYRSGDKRLTLEGGRYVQQYNSNEPIHTFVNTLTSLFAGDNWMKLYEQDFVDLKYRQRLNDKFTINSIWSLSRRYELDNHTDYTFFKDNKEHYTPNAPLNVETLNTGFENNTSFTGSIGFEARPWVKYRIRNGNKSRIQNSSPIFSLDYKKGFNGIFGSDVNYDLIEAGLRQQIKFGIRGTFDLNLKAGKYLNADKLYFMDYKHFLGNKTPIITTDPVGSFRLMDYYLYSTRDQYLSVSAHYHFRKFLITRIPFIRLMGVQENFFVNYLKTSASKNYTELGYGLDGILRIFRLEGAVAFTDGQYQDYGFRIGISSILSVNFGD